MNSIHNLTRKKVWLAPLAGLTDQAFRIISKNNGADVLVTEMVSADGLVNDFDRSYSYTLFNKEEKPLGIQIFGSNPEIMAKGTELLLKRIINDSPTLLPAFIDINMGCPVKKVVKRNAGSALLRDLPLASSIIKSVKDVLKHKNILLCVKIRAGWDSNEIVGLQAAQIISESGADMLVVHPRTRSQMYAGKSDWSLIRDIKNSVSIPVIGNGDIRTVDEAKKMFDYTGCDSIMIGRGALGNPWIFNEIKEYLLTGEKKQLPYKKRYEIIKEHFLLSIVYTGEKQAVREMKTHFCHYTKGIKGSSKVRSLINNSTEAEEILNLLKELYDGCY